MRIDMPDGSGIIFVELDDGFVLGTQGAQVEGETKRPTPSSVTYTGDQGTDAVEMRDALKRVFESAQA